MSQVDTLNRFKSWLEGKPPEWVAAIAGRAALRVLPLALDSVSAGELEETVVESGIWRASLIARLVQQVPLRQSDNVGLPSAIGLLRPIIASLHAANAAYCAAGAYAAENNQGVFSLLSDDVAHHAIAAVEAATPEEKGSSLIAGAAVWAAIDNDCMYLDLRTGDASSLRARPLWPRHRYPKTEVAWGRIRYQAYAKTKWSEWHRWYERRLKGSRSEWGLSPAGDHEMARRLIEADEKFWKRGEEDPAYVNAQIAAWRRELTPEQLPRQHKGATGYGSDASGRVVRLPLPLERRLTDTPLYRRDYDELRSDVLRLAQHGQRLGAALNGPLAALQRSLPEDLAEAETVSLWRDFHRVSGALAKHEIALRSKDFSPDRLDEACVVDLRGVVSAGNIVVLGDPKLLALSDSTRPAQLRVEVVEEAALAQPLVEALTEEPLIADEDVRFDAEANAAAIAEGEDNLIDAKVAEVATKAQRNVFAAVITSARRFAKAEPGLAAKGIREGGYREIGKRMLEYAWNNRGAFARYAQHAYSYISANDWQRIFHAIGEALKFWR